MRLSYEYSTSVVFRPSVGRHNILLRCLPAKEDFQQIRSECFSLSEGFWYKEGVDGLGNRIISGGTKERHTSLEYTSCGQVEISTYCIPEPSPHPMFTLPSQLTMPSKVMLTLLPPSSDNFLEDCMNIVHAVRAYVVYTPGVTNMLTTAEDVYRLRQGVCQDYAHLMIALCRAKGYVARYVCGLMTGEGSTHAWVEVHDGHCWYAFDPTNDTAIATGYIKLAHGRDASDCPVSRGMYTGVAEQNTMISVKVKRI